MQCPECLTFNNDRASYCTQCGGPLAGGSRHGDRRKTPVVLAVLMVVVIIVAAGSQWFVYRSSVKNDPGAGPTVSSANDDGDEGQLGSAVADPPTMPESGPVPAGLVRFDDRWGRPIHSQLAAVAGGRWVALPRRACLGATGWQMALAAGRELPVNGGIWRLGDEVGLWVVESDEIGGPPLFSWDGSGALLEWRGLRSGRELIDIDPGRTSRDGLFRVFTLPDDMQEPGVFRQDGAVVGWTFGSMLAGGWLWAGADGDSLRLEAYVEDFYARTFAGGREELLAEAVAVRDGRAGPRRDSLAQLTKFSQAWRSRALLVEEDTPVYLRSQHVLPFALEAAGSLVTNDPGRLAGLLDDSALLGAGSGDLLVVAMRAWSAANGPGGAASLGLRLERDLLPGGSPALGRYEALLGKLFADWLQLFIDAADVPGGWSVFADAQGRLPGDGLIHLRGVEIALVDGDWREAERLVNSRTYGEDLADLEKVLRGRVSALKALEGKIVIRFRPGARIIPTEVVLNRRFAQSYLVDTGATLTTIPTATLRRLGVVITADTPTRRVSTANGDVVAPLVTLATMEIGGWEVQDIDVLVLDLPNQEDHGLLGLNFLNNFRMNLNASEGLLTLEPK